MKRRTDNLRCPSEIKDNLNRKYAVIEKLDVSKTATQSFKRKAYEVCNG